MHCFTDIEDPVALNSGKFQENFEDISEGIERGGDTALF